MKVSELIKRLSNYPQDKEVMVYKENFLPDKIESIIYKPGIDIVFIKEENLISTENTNYYQ